MSDLTHDEAVKIDQAMSDHMYHHSISNSYPGMACDVACRTRAIASAVNAVLAERRQAAGEPTTPEGDHE